MEQAQQVSCHHVQAQPPLPPSPNPHTQSKQSKDSRSVSSSQAMSQNIPEEALHAILVACTRIFLCVPEELLVHALVEGVPQEVAPEAVQPVHLIRQTWTCQCSTHNLCLMPQQCRSGKMLCSHRTTLTMICSQGMTHCGISCNDSAARYAVKIMASRCLQPWPRHCLKTSQDRRWSHAPNLEAFSF